MIDRRRILAGAAAAAVAGAFLPVARGRAEDTGQWLPLTSDDGAPVPNLRLPVELTSQLEELVGVVWVGADKPDVTFVEAYDYNCPWCHKAADDIEALLKAHPELRIGLLNNPILSPQSAQAAKVELAVLKLKGAAAAYALHRALFARRGLIDGPAALQAAAGLGLPRATIEKTADSAQVRAALTAQMKLAASLGLSATPSFVLAGMGVLGYPGSRSLARMVSSVSACDALSC
ncbi:hypothetical protein GCM10010994_56100 [Chelatococcus reniformis]|uniref:Thioredoxin domain-containing protein n=2 Tax=Chelatococcus reniformis TaxID=1494448 RepID=A0A916XNX2_9HYPH|nr:DsbA family protein [Chelatococcus reniformis]GGC91095.1 hypothetical protein GCM10010994_56100 [Chelatococcus reniformis]